MRWILLAGIAFLTVELSISVKVRLVGGKHRYEGRIEVFYRRVWRAVCDHRWNKKAARVVCRMLGYPDALRFTKGPHAFGRGNGKFWLDDVKCSGEEESIDKCSHRPWGWNNCLPFNQAGTVCKRHMSDLVIEPEPSISSREVRKVNIRLLGPVVDDYISEGIVQVEHKGKWGYICPSAWTPVNSFVLCGQLGFPNSEKQGSYSVALQEVEPVYWLDKVSCQGWESSIVSCLHAGFDRHQCSDTGALNIKCVRRNITKPLDVRLRSGVLVSEGRVEVEYHGFWGTVCDDHWTMKEANVVCRSLGYGSAAMATISAYYGRGMGRVLLDEVVCKGIERHISQCRHSGWRKSNCHNHEDAGVRCYVPPLQGHQIRILGGTNSKEGRVEVFHDGKWGTVCGDDWGIEEAMTVCRQLNLGYAGKAVTKNNFSETDLKVIMSGVRCRVDEISLYNCQHDEWKNTTCSSKESLAGVVCVNALPDLVIDTDLLRIHMEMNAIALEYLQCALEENCLSASAAAAMRQYKWYRRRLLRFSVKVENRGLDHFRPSVDKSTWQWHQCHKHYHSMETFSSYDLISQRTREKVAQGHKASFCLEDTKCDPGFEQVWNCSDTGEQGISPGCYDIYYYNIDCQWVDVSDITHGAYYLRVHINPGNQVAESDFRNNVATCLVYDYGSYVIARSCRIENCESGIDTHGGNAGGNCCVFPFKYRGKLYHACTKDGFSKKWCSTTFDFRKDRNWGLCYD